MARYFRLQPAGLDLAGHYSEDSSGDLSDGLHVFEGPIQLVCCDVSPSNYGDEVVVIESDNDWPNGDVEGCCIDPDDAAIVARYSWSDFLAAYFPGLPERPRGRDYDECLREDWETL